MDNSFVGKIKKLGFGLMRLPKNGEEIDIEQTKEMVDLFLAAGFNYFDTAWVYNGSEDAIRQALVERYPRDSYYLATKIAPWVKCETREDAISQLEDSLKRTGAGYFDFYLLHNMGEGRTEVFDKFDLWSWVQEKKSQGAVRHVGFSAHCTPEHLDKILTDHPEMEFVQLQINYADWDHPSIQSRRCYEVARKHGKPLIVMEPVKGGLLADPIPEVLEILKEGNPDASAASWAVRFAADLDGVMTVLSGMSNIEQMRDNISYMKEFTSLSESERQVISHAQKKMNSLPLIPCTSCDYCLKVCPMQIGISGSFGAMNFHTLYGNMDKTKKRIQWSVVDKGLKTADQCIFCGRCEKACPQHIKIRDHLLKISKTIK